MRNTSTQIALAVALTLSAQASAATLQMKLVATDYDAGTGTWTDTSGMGNDATQVTVGSRPALVAGQTPTGSSVVRFDGTDDFFNLPNFASGFSAGEAFLLVKIDADPPAANEQSGIWDFGSGTTSHYPFGDGVIYDSFGSTVRKTTGDPATALTEFTVYNVMSAAGLWESRLNNLLHHTTGSNSVSFITAPLLGRSTSTRHLDGDVVEFRFYEGTLTPEERAGVYSELRAAHIVPVPEPSTSLLLGLGALGLLGHARRRRSVA